MVYFYVLIGVCLYVCMGALMAWFLYTKKVEMSKFEKRAIFSIIILGWPIILIAIVGKVFRMWLED